VRASITLFMADFFSLKQSIFWPSADLKLVPNDLVNAMYRHQSNIDCLMARTAGFICFISTVNGHSKKSKNVLEDVALAAGAQQNLSNLYSLDIYDALLCQCMFALSMCLLQSLCLAAATVK
jgi:hypothetical protein